MPKAVSCYRCLHFIHSRFVQFHSMEEAGRALDQLNGVKLGLHKIVVELAYAAAQKSSAGQSQ